MLKDLITSVLLFYLSSTVRIALSEINRLFGNVNQNDSSSATATWIPAVDVHEYADRFEFYIDIPGVDPNKVELILERGIPTLSGRRFVLPDTVDGEKKH